MIKLFLGMVAFSVVALGCSAATTASPKLEAHYAARLSPEQDFAQIKLTIQQQGRRLREIAFSIKGELQAAPTVSAGKIIASKEGWRWILDDSGGQLSYDITLSNRRNDKGYDSLATDNWLVTRLEDLFPTTQNKAVKNSIANTTMTIDAPKNWSTLTRYGRQKEGKQTRIPNEKRILPRPTGWLISGKLGIRTDTIAGHRVTIAAPKGSGYPRIPLLAFMNWTLPTLSNIFPSLPEDVLIVSGDDRMWRGGLSGPGSLYLHQERPLISENATSTPLHELIHIATRWRAAPGDDWIVEGIAEYYSLKILFVSGGISEQRFEEALSELDEWAERRKGALTDPSKGADTAFAVKLFRTLDEELAAQKPAGSLSLDDAIRDLLANHAGVTDISRSSLADSVTKILGRKSATLGKYLSSSTL